MTAPNYFFTTKRWLSFLICEGQPINFYQFNYIQSSYFYFDSI